MTIYVIIALGGLALIGVVVHELRSWRKPGHHISQNASMGDAGVNDAHMANRTNIHNHSDFGGPPSGL